MKDIIEVRGETYESVGLLRERFDMSNCAIRSLIRRGLLPEPLRLGKHRYFRVDKVEELLSRGQ